MKQALNVCTKFSDDWLGLMLSTDDKKM